MTTYIVSILLAFATALLVTPLMIAVARRVGAVDTAGISHRKVHAEDIPRLGGAAIVIAFYAPLAGLAWWETRVGDAILGDARLVQGLLVGGLAIAALGMVDDLRGAGPRLKFAVQIAVALMMVSLGFEITRIDLPFLPMLDLGWLGIPLTVFWIVGVTNAVNLIDGLDGLAAGIALFGLLPMVVLAISKGNLALALICCCLAGAVLGFLVFNFHPARIFMGDTGSMFLGFVLAVIAIATAHKGRVAVAMLTPVLALGLPILDTLLAIARRAWMGQSLFVGDRQHLHHRLMAQGMTHRRTVLVMYAFAALFAMLGLAVHFNRDRENALLFLLSIVVAGVLLRKVGYLALPGGPTDASSAIRARNQLVRDSWARHDARRFDAGSLVDAVSDLGASSGAAQVRLELDLPGEPVRSWQWTDEAAPLIHPFPLIDQQGLRHGQVVFAWADDGTFHDAILPRIEVAVRLLAERLVVPDAGALP